MKKILCMILTLFVMGTVFAASSKMDSVPQWMKNAELVYSNIFCGVVVNVDDLMTDTNGYTDLTGVRVKDDNANPGYKVLTLDYECHEPGYAKILMTMELTVNPETGYSALTAIDVNNGGQLYSYKDDFSGYSCLSFFARVKSWFFEF